MGTKIKVAFFDLDGTLIGKNGLVSKEDLESLQRLKSLGIKVAIASGRPMTAVQSINKLIGFDGMSSVSAGSVIFDPTKNKAVEVFNFEAQKFQRLWHELQRGGFYTEVHTVSETIIVGQHPFAAIHQEYMDIRHTIADESTILELPEVIKVGVMVETEKDLARVRETLANVPGITSSMATGAKHPSLYFMNITDINADRHRTFARILEIEKVTADEVISFGDSESDLIFITQAGTGVAMENAPPAVKNHAQMITGSVENSGVSKALKHLVFDGL